MVEFGATFGDWLLRKVVVPKFWKEVIRWWIEELDRADVSVTVGVPRTVVALWENLLIEILMRLLLDLLGS
jgi:hypothetical protein